MASDSMVLSGSSTRSGSARKVFVTADGGLLGVAGDPRSIQRVVSWVNDGARLADWPSVERNEDDIGQVTMLRVTTDGVWIGSTDTPGWYVHEGEYAAIGCGERAALAAMHAGASAEGAVYATIAHDVMCGGDVRAVRLSGRHSRDGQTVEVEPMAATPVKRWPLCPAYVAGSGL